MSHNRPKSLAEQMFRAGSPVQELAAQAAAMADLTTLLRTALPPEMAAELRSASLREDGTLVIAAASPVWANRLRYEAARLLDACKARHPRAERVKVRVSGSAPEAG